MFHLNFIPEISEKKINHQQDVLFIGSCFSERVSQKLFDLKFETYSNPLGIVFNPKSIYTSLTNCVHQSEINDAHFIEKDNHWFNLDSHSSLFSSKKDDLKNTINNSIDVWSKKIKTAKWLVITFGSAYCYEFNDTKKIVTNCHKLPANQFTKKLLSVNNIVSDYDLLISDLKTINPHLTILFTVSPVKHLKDGVIENNLSKSILIQAVHELKNKHSNCFYFPTYELITDDLRDYRFYETDMAHPNLQAVNYVFDKFADVYFNDETKKINKLLIEINLAYKHKPFNNKSTSHNKFKDTMLVKCIEIIKEFPFIDLNTEIKYFSH